MMQALHCTKKFFRLNDFYYFCNNGLLTQLQQQQQQQQQQQRINTALKFENSWIAVEKWRFLCCCCRCCSCLNFFGRFFI